MEVMKTREISKHKDQAQLAAALAAERREQVAALKQQAAAGASAATAVALAARCAPPVSALMQCHTALA